MFEPSLIQAAQSQFENFSFETVPLSGYMFVRIFCTKFKRNVHQFHTHRRFTMKIHHSLTGFFFALKHCMQCNIGLDTFLRICKLFIPELKKTSAAVSQPSAATTSLYRKRNQPYFYFHHFDHHVSMILINHLS